ncbi:MAG: Ig-like domain-containing protein, partial [Ilumatobacter sp.]
AMQATFYGLPFYSIDEVAPPPPPAPVVVPEPDPLAADLPSAEIALDEDFERVDGPDGTYWFWNDEGDESTQAVHFRPIQPKVVADVTPADPNLEARGAILTDLASLDIPGIDPVIVRPTIDLSDNEPEPDAGQIADPAVLQTVSAEFTPEGDRQRLVTSGGQFDGTAEQGTQRLFTTIDADIYYADVTNPDRLPPVIESIDGVELGNDVIVNVEVSDESSNVVRVVMLYVVDPGPGVTESWDLVEFARDPATGIWSAAVPNPGGEIEYFVQALDAAGNVAVSSDKGLLYEAAEVAPPPADLIPALARPADSNGWYTSPVAVDIPDPKPFTVQVSISGGEPFAYEGPVTVSTSGNRRVEFRRNDGLIAEVFVSVDLALPTSTISEPVLGAQLPFGQPVVTSFSCSDVGSGIETCTATLDGTPVQSGSTRNDLAIGPHTLVVTSTDIAGNITQSTRTFDVVADVTLPTATIISPADGALVAAEVTVDFDCADELPGVSCTGLLDGQPVTDGATVTLASGPAALVVTATDAAGNSADTTSNFTVDADAPTVSIISPVDGAEVDFPASVTIDFDCTDPNLASCTATLDGDPVADGDVVTDLDLGEHTVVATGVDQVGNSASVSSIFTIGDDSAPTIDITSPTDGSVVGTDVTFGFTCSDNVPAGLTCEGELDGDTAVDDGETVTLASGSHTLVVTATDGENNTATDSSTFTVVENVAPVVSVDQPADGATFGLAAGGSIDIAASCADAGSGMDFCTLTFDGNAVGTPGVTSATASVDVSTAGLGQHTIAVTGADLDGNTATDSITITVVDDLAPTISISSPADGDTFATGEEFTVTFDCTDESGAADCTALLDGVPVESGDVVSFVAPGQRTLTVSAVDGASNEADASVSVSIEDQTDPTVTITAPGEGATVTSPVTFVFDCADELPGVTCTAVVDPDTAQAVTVVTGVPVALSLGEHTLVVTATDAAGNTATDSRAFTVSEETPPVVSIDQPLDGATFGLAAGGSIDISATCADDGAGMDSCALTFDGDAVGIPGSIMAIA